MCFRSYVGFVWVPPLFDRVAVAVLLTGFSNVQDDSTMRMGGGGGTGSSRWEMLRREDARSQHGVDMHVHAP